MNKSVISNKAKQVLVENELNELLKNVKTISSKGFFICCLYSQIFQNYLVFIPTKKYIK